MDAAALFGPPLATSTPIPKRRRMPKVTGRSKARKQRMTQEKREAKQAAFMKKAEAAMHEEAAKQVRRQKSKFRRMVQKAKKEKKRVSLYELLDALHKAAPNRDLAITGNTTVGSFLKHFKIHSKRVSKLM